MRKACVLKKEEVAYHILGKGSPGCRLIMETITDGQRQELEREIVTENPAMWVLVYAPKVMNRKYLENLVHSEEGMASVLIFADEITEESKKKFKSEIQSFGCKKLVTEADD